MWHEVIGRLLNSCLRASRQPTALPAGATSVPGVTGLHALLNANPMSCNVKDRFRHTTLYLTDPLLTDIYVDQQARSGEAAAKTAVISHRPLQCGIQLHP
jgi:hypothetical protein